MWVLTMGKRTRALTLLVCFLLLFACLVPTSGAERSGNLEVNAGVFFFDGYHMRDGDAYTGYGIEVLGLISQYSHLNFSFRGYDRSWEDMLAMLDSGEIDVVTSARKTVQLEEKYAFSLPIGRVSTVLSTQASNTGLISGDYGTYQGIRVGVLAGSEQNQRLADFARENGFSYRTVEYTDENRMKADLRLGVLDAVLSGSLRTAENERTLDTIETDYFYAMVRKEDTGLLAEINYAIDQMNRNEGDWSNVLYYKYYGNSSSSVLFFTARERTYIQDVVSGKKRITVTAMSDRKPYSYVEDGELKGILPEYFAQLMELAGLPYETVVPGDRAEYYALAHNDGVDVVMDWQQEQSKSDRYSNTGFYTQAYMNIGVAMVTRKDFSGTISTLAVADLQGDVAIEQDMVGDARVLNCETTEGALRAVLDRRADAAYVYTYTAQSFVNDDSTASLQYSMVNSMRFDIKVYLRNSSDHELISILNKSIRKMPDDSISDLIAKYTANAPENMSVGQYMRANPEILLASALMTAVVIGVIVVLYMRSRWNKQLLDITERSNQELAEQGAILEVALAEAQRANVAKTTFLNSMSHDIRTPMNAIIGFTSLAVTHIDDQERVRSYLDKILTSSKHLLSLINDILDMSRIESGKVRIEETEVSLPEIIRDLKTFVQSDVKEKQLSFKVEADVTNETILCDKLRLNQVLLNLLSNAVKYTRPGGSVSFRVIQTEDAPEGYASYQFRIKDTGIGMSKEFLAHLFEPFEREQTATVSGIQGTGLGLSITKNLVDMMHGTIEVNSETGKGSEFVVSFLFRVKDAPEEIEPETVGPVEAPDAQFLIGKKILLVEDNELNQEIAQTILEGIGLVIDTAGDGTEAVAAMKEAPAGTYDLILMDIQMPVMDGYEAARTIRAMEDPAKAGIPIVAMTANAFEEDRRRAVDAGMNDHVPKPIDVPKLMETLGRILKD